jgi:hypothetical protein
MAILNVPCFCFLLPLSLTDGVTSLESSFSTGADNSAAVTIRAAPHQKRMALGRRVANEFDSRLSGKAVLVPFVWEKC